MNIRKLAVAMSIVVSISLVPAKAGSQSDDPNSQKHVGVRLPLAEEVFGMGAPRECATGWLTLFGGAGNKSGSPYELTYLDWDNAMYWESNNSNNRTEAVELNDTDSKWNSWNKNIAKVLNKRLSASQKRVEANDKLVVCECSFHIGLDGKITKITMMPPSPSEAFNLLIVETLQSLQGDEALKFPKPIEGVTKTGRFVQNYGPKYLLQIGEAEPKGSAPPSTTAN